MGRKKKQDYTEAEEIKPVDSAEVLPIKGKKQSKNEQIEDFLTMKYQFRFNVIKCKTEFKHADKNEEWQPVTKYILNSMKRELDAYAITTACDNLKTILESAFAPAVNPVKEYLKELAPWDGTDYIGQLCSTVKCKNEKNWSDYFKKWLTAVVANIFIDERCANHCCLVLTGAQGKYKTTWLNNLCPASLKKYLYIGKINPQDKDSIARIADYFLINIDDQLRELNKKDENQIKSLITQDYVTFRRPYDPFDTEYPHLASFMASVNQNDFLSDITGNRRFLAFEVTGIDINTAKNIDMNPVYAQALHLFKSGFKYYFTDDEMETLAENNMSFQVITEEEELLLQYYLPCSRSEATEYITTSMIKTNLEMFTKQKLNKKKLGEALTKLNFDKWQRTRQKHTIWVWSVKQKDDQQRKEQDLLTEAELLAKYFAPGQNGTAQKLTAVQINEKIRRMEDGRELDLKKLEAALAAQYESETYAADAFSGTGTISWKVSPTELNSEKEPF